MKPSSATLSWKTTQNREMSAISLLPTLRKGSGKTGLDETNDS